MSDSISTRYAPGNVPHNKGKSKCPHGVGDMSKCPTCRAVKDAAYYQRKKADRKQFAARKEREAKRVRVYTAAQKQRKRDWWRKKLAQPQQLDSILNAFLTGAKP